MIDIVAEMEGLFTKVRDKATTEEQVRVLSMLADARSRSDDETKRNVIARRIGRILAKVAKRSA